MDQIRIGVRVPLAAAVAAGRSEYGYASVALTDADVAQLSAGARALLRVWDGDDTRHRGLVGVPGSTGSRIDDVEVVRADVATTIAAIEALYVAAEAKRASELAAVEARIAQAIAAPDEEWIGAGRGRAYYVRESGDLSTSTSGRERGLPYVLDYPSGVYLGEDDRRDPRVVAHRAAIDLTARIAEHERVYAQWAAGVDAAKRESEENSAAWSAACREYAAQHVPDYARAAQDGCDMRSVATDRHTRDVRSLLQSYGHTLVEAYEDAEQHTRPHQRAYDVLDRVRALLDAADTVSGIGIVTGIDTQIVRADTCEWSRCRSGKRTCVEISIRYGDDTASEMYVYADAAPAHAHMHEEDES